MIKINKSKNDSEREMNLLQPLANQQNGTWILEKNVPASHNLKNQ